MTKTLQTDWRYNLTAQYVDDSDLNEQRGVLGLDIVDSLATGTAADQASQVWYDTRSLAATAEELDLAGGVTDAFGAALTFAKVKQLLIRNNNTTSGHTLVIGPGTTNGVTTIWAGTSPTEVIGPNGVMVKANPGDGYAITGGSADTIKINAGTNTVSYDIIVVGT
ncbi:MAG TPA: hypothetical protein VMW24_13190 [Sedimentisphaerales bacterium]|nr:hypothetical protein [Sedimentisphaerales bacterium]